MRKIKGLCVAAMASLALFQVVFPNRAFQLIGLFGVPTEVKAANDKAPPAPDKGADKDKPGFPNVVYSQPLPALGDLAKSNAGAATTVTAATADFDSDGVPDLISVDQAGQVHLMKGDARSIFPNSVSGEEKGDSAIAPFSGVTSAGSLGFAPDEIVAGDFNADGHSDIIAAKFGSGALVLLAGDGRGGFRQSVNQDIPGAATSLASGEIGRADGQADLAVGFTAEGKYYVAVFEHPEGAFSHKPEIFPIPHPAVSISIGQFDRDPYADIAIGGGESLTIIHERGQAYPLDMLPAADIVRPAAAVRTMRLDFTVRSLVAAEMDGTRGDGIAMLAADGSVHYYKAMSDASPMQVRPKAKTALGPSRFTPVGVDPNKFVVSKQAFPQTEADADAEGLLMANTDEVKSKGLTKVLEDKGLARVAERAKIPTDKLAAEDAAKAARHAEVTAERKRLFEEGLAAKPVEFSSWKMTTIATDSRLATAAATGTAKLVKARVSSSGVDDLLIADAANNGINVVGRWLEEDEKPTGRAHVVQIETNINPTTVIPMRLNSDGRSDLVFFGNSSAAPDVLMSMPSTVLTVNTADDVGGGNCQNDGQVCGLRRAVFWANLIPDSVIAFNIPGTGVQTIHLTSPLADLVRPMTIDGTSQPGYVNKPLIEIKGDIMAAGNAEGFRVTTSNIVIRGLAINQMPGLSYGGSVIGGSGIVVLTYIGNPVTVNTTIEANFLGTDPTGAQAFGNDGNGVQIYNADSNLIGGTIPQARNILSGNGNYAQNKNGVGFAITGGNYNRVFNNYVGTDVTGTLKVSNTDGAFVTGRSNQVGGDQPGTANVISGNGTPPDQYGHCSGVGLRINQLYSVDYAEPLTGSTQVKGNFVGTNASGFAALGNCTTGIVSTGNINTNIGSITPEGRNTVSGNKYDGIWCGFNDSAYFPISGGCFIEGNDIGTNVTGNAAIPNSGENACSGFCLLTDTVWLPTSDIDFVVVGSPGGTTPNGACTGQCNLISGNHGIYLNGGTLLKSGLGFGLIINNYMGTNRSGDSALPNETGPSAYYGSALIGATLGDGQGGVISGGNLISGNYAAGAIMQSIDGGGLFWVKGNVFGLSADGLSSVPNGVGGTESNAISVFTQGGTSASVGGLSPTDRNIIANTTSDGTGQRGNGINLTTYGTVAVQNNWIGLDRQGNSAPNSSAGIKASGNGRAFIGGGGAGSENIITNNGSSGVLIYNYVGPFTNLQTSGVSVRQNIINNNGGLGIDLTNIVSNGGLFGPDGVTANDCQDFDEGANRLQNYPELYAPVQNQNGTLRIDTTLKSVPSRQFIIDYYLNNQADPTNYGEGQTWLGSGTMTTNGNSFASASFNTTQQLPVTAIITATATDENGNTSEFSCAAGVCTTNQSFEQAVSLAPETPFCIQPIVVNTTGDENDLDGENPVQNRDGLCDVDANTSGEQCTLRAAIQEANARPGFDLINFAIPGAGIQTIIIHQTAILPSIKETAQIDATSQPGYNGTPLIDVRGEVQNAQATAIGLGIIGSDITVRGLAINHFAVANIVIGNPSLATNNNVIESCFIGIGADGSADTSGNTTIGISLGGSAATIVSNNRIGSSTGGNTIANNSLGIGLSGSNVHDNKIIGNKIGTDVNGITAIPNFSGIATLSGAHHNTIGGILNEEGNVISGNASTGINLDDNSHHNTVTGNYIGTRSGGDITLPNGSVGIQVLGGSNNNTIGGTSAYRNIISGNSTNGTLGTTAEVLLASGTSGNTVVGNNICLNTNGDQSFGGLTGIAVAGSNNTIGGSRNSPNVIGCAQIGVAFIWDGIHTTQSNKLSFNKIGTLANGFTPTNQNFGVFVQNDIQNTIVDNNLISGNQAVGVYLGMGSQLTTVSNNRIGTNADGNGAVPNGAGVLLTKTTNNTVKDNLISGNHFIGLFLGDDFSPPSRPGLREIFESPFMKTLAKPSGTQQFVSNNAVSGNRIGMTADAQSPLGNGLSGINIGENARYNTIGGDRAAGEGNYIGGQSAPSTAMGIYVGSIFTDVNDARIPQNNFIRGNYIGFGTQNASIPNAIGIRINNARDNFIGPDPGLCPYDGSCDPLAYGNYIGNNIGAGILYEGDGSIDNNVRGNVIGGGPGFTLNSLAPNGSDGITYKSNNSTTIESNVIAGNQGDGVHVAGHRSFTLEDNYIGANQGDGVRVAGDEGPSPNPKGQVKNGRPEGIGFLRLLGNSIGQIKIGNAAVQAANSLNGIELINSVNTMVGSATSGKRSTITSNTDNGIKITGGNSSNITIEKSDIGTDVNGNTGLGNGGDGILIDGAPNVVVGGNAAGNTVSGNNGNGIMVENAGGTVVVGNSVGVVPAQNNARLANQKNGVAIKNSYGGFLGGLSTQLGNTISGNIKNGVLIYGINSSANNILRNAIGTDMANTLGLGNNENGVRVSAGAHNNVIGGDIPDNGNNITGNGGSGIQIDDETTGQRPEGSLHSVNNVVRNNSIFLNTGGGILFGINGFVYNDPQDVDEGPNRIQNYPQLSQFHIDQAGQACIQVFVDTDPANANYGANGLTVEFFLSNSLGQGLRTLGTGNASWTAADYSSGSDKLICIGDATFLGLSASDIITSTATDADGNTSEFSPIANSSSPTPSPTPTVPSVAGTVTYGNALGDPIVRFVPDVLISAAGSTVSISTLTGANGSYGLSGFDSGSYTITPSKTAGQNNSISSYDAGLISQHVVGSPFPHLAGNQLIVADVSGNGDISSFDAAEIAHYVVGNSPTGATGIWKFNPTSIFHAAITSTISGEDYSSLLMGEVSGNWSGSGLRPAKGPVSSINVNAPHIAAAPLGNVIIPVQVNGIQDKGVISYEFDLRYDPAVIRPLDNPVDLMGTVSNGLNVVVNTRTPGRLRVAVYGPAPISGDGVLLNLKFTAIGTAGSESPLIWEQIMFNEGNPATMAVNGWVELFRSNPQ